MCTGQKNAARNASAALIPGVVPAIAEAVPAAAENNVTNPGAEICAGISAENIIIV
jgi:hypothetical protein